MASRIDIDINEAALTKLTSWESEMGRSFKRLAFLCEVAAKSRVPNEYSKVGWLRDSIDQDAGKKRNARGIWFSVGSTVKYALYVESGTRPHSISPKKPKGRLVFFWRRVGETVFMRGVKHPGSRAYRYLEDGAITSIAIWQRTG